ncbi:MAG: hypothetical protein RBS82_08365, partial [Syntrophales bacterium]|nr:hypothetical protein [Syntrophales bacterium]
MSRSIHREYGHRNANPSPISEHREGKYELFASASTLSVELGFHSGQYARIAVPLHFSELISS